MSNREPHVTESQLQEVTVTVTNLAPHAGTFQTPFWVGFHNGFDTYDRGRPVSPGAESLAEDGDTALITEEFAFSEQGQIDGTLGDAPIAPGETVEHTFLIDPSQGNANFFNYASMILPSNDTWIANGNEFAHQVFDEEGNFIPLDITVTGEQALDAGSEVNDEIPENTAFFGQQMPDTGVEQNEGVQLAEGFLPPGSGGILDDPMFANADYTAEDYEFARIQVTAEPITDSAMEPPAEPPSEPMMEPSAEPASESPELQLPELEQVTVAITNNAPHAGTFQTPFWVGFHNGFDTYDRGRPVSPGAESLAEDGDTTLITEEFAFSGQGQIDGTLGNAPIAPGETVYMTFNVDPSQGNANFFNYASMVLPSNDTWIANGNEFAHQVFDEEGNFMPLDITVTGEQALDAGSEVNDEIPENTAFFGQQMPDTGVEQNEGVQLAEGFLPPGSGGILDDPMFANADYTAEDYEFAQIQVTNNSSAKLSSTLDGAQEVEAGDDRATGISELLLNERGDALSYSLTVSGLDFGAFIGDGTAQTEYTGDDVTRLHIHDGNRGENGDVALGIIDLVEPAADGQDSDDLTITMNDDGTTTLTGIWEESDPTLIGLSEFTDEINHAAPGEDIGLYWNIHTEDFPGGAIRGQLQGQAIEPDPVTGNGVGDRYALASDGETTTVTDFEDGLDYFTLEGGLSFGQLNIVQVEQNTQINIIDTGEVLAELTGISVEQITEVDFA